MGELKIFNFKYSIQYLKYFGEFLMRKILFIRFKFFFYSEFLWIKVFFLKSIKIRIMDIFHFYILLLFCYSEKGCKKSTNKEFIFWFDHPACVYGT